MSKAKLLFLDEEWSWENMTLWEYLSEGNYPSAWSNFFIEHSKELKEISDGIVEEAQNSTIYPPIYQVFRAFLPLDKVKVVVLGQDPYHNGSAVGYCFSVLPGNQINPSLRSIYKELEDEGFEVKRNGDLTHWAKQGCLMLNTALTVEKGNAGVHTGIWYEFTEKVIKHISDNTENVAWLLMGSKALKFIPFIKGKTFITSHPMPLSAYKGFRGHAAFMGSNVFREINNFLKEKGRKTISW